MAVPSKRSFSEVTFKQGDHYGRLLPEIAKFLTELTRYGDIQRAKDSRKMEPSVFDGKTVVMSVEDYLIRLIHRMIFTAFVLATKYHEEDLYTNSHYSQIGGIVRGELARLELFFVKATKFELFVSRDEFDITVAALTAAANSNA